MDKLVIQPGQDGYSTNQCGTTLTAGELIEILSEYDEDTPVFLSTGQVYGVKYTSISSVDEEEEE